VEERKAWRHWSGEDYPEPVALVVLVVCLSRTVLLADGLQMGRLGHPRNPQAESGKLRAEAGPTGLGR
jgi:hypothetical protein